MSSDDPLLGCALHRVSTNMIDIAGALCSISDDSMSDKLDSPPDRAPP